MSRGVERIGGETVYSGRLVDVRVERFRHADGEEVSREIVRHRGAVGIVAHDEQHVWLVRQPRETVEQELLEIPAGRLDVDGESPLEAARRELAEEVGLGAERWEPLYSFYTSAGFSDECVHLFHATDLHDSSAESGENERIEIVPWPLATLDDAIAECRDGKTLIGLLWLARRLNA
ncbi:MAG TPA: NUDIX hydrolase [Solirubrobacteraceae bacterium]|nr:NUDIX hydrolase [Solirubrobacteraceae bacterium]